MDRDFDCILFGNFRWNDFNYLNRRIHSATIPSIYDVNGQPWSRRNPGVFHGWLDYRQDGLFLGLGFNSDRVVLELASSNNCSPFMENYSDDSLNDLPLGHPRQLLQHSYSNCDGVPVLWQQDPFRDLQLRAVTCVRRLPNHGIIHQPWTKLLWVLYRHQLRALLFLLCSYSKIWLHQACK